MTPAEIIEQAAEDGVLLALSPTGSIFGKGVQSAIERWRPAIRQSRLAIVRLLVPGGDGWSADDWQAFFRERAGIAEFNGDLPRIEADARAFECCLAEWIIRNPVDPLAGSCFGCGEADHQHNPMLPFGMGDTGQVWLHSHCQPAWYASRKAKAVASLAAMGIVAPTDFPDDFGKNGSR